MNGASASPAASLTAAAAAAAAAAPLSSLSAAEAQRVHGARSWFVVEALSARQARKFATYAMAMAHFQLEVGSGKGAKGREGFPRGPSLDACVISIKVS